MAFTSFVCLVKNLQKAAPNNAQTKEPEAPIRDRIAAKITKPHTVLYTGKIYSEVAVIAYM